VAQKIIVKVLNQKPAKQPKNVYSFFFVFFFRRAICLSQWLLHNSSISHWAASAPTHRFLATCK